MTTLAIDLDGTLLHPDNRISEGNRRALLALQPETDIVICSARPLRAILSLTDSAGLLPVIRAIGACNGAVIYDCRTQSVLSRATLSPAMLSALQNLLTTGWHASVRMLCSVRRGKYQNTPFMKLNYSACQYRHSRQTIFSAGQISLKSPCAGKRKPCGSGLKSFVRSYRQRSAHSLPISTILNWFPHP